MPPRCARPAGGSSRARTQAAVLAAALILPSVQALAAPADIERGRFIIKFGGCNDCHTDAYMTREGKVPESQWLTGSPVGFQGPWGTSYATNRRLRLAQLSEDECVTTAGARRQPPMPGSPLPNSTTLTSGRCTAT